MRNSWTIAAGLLVLCGSGVAPADPPATGGDTGGARSASPTQGGFFSSLKQAFNQDVEREIVWGYFDVGSPPDTHRFYCLMDPKTGKREPNGVAGETFVRRDGTTGLRRPAVSPTSCSEAQQKGILITSGFVVKGGGGGPKPAVAPAQETASVAAPAPMPAIAPTPAATPAPAATPTAAPAAAESVAPTRPSADHAADRAYIRKAESDWGESEVTRDAGVLERILSDDFVGVDVDGTHYSKADALQEYRTRPSNYVSNHIDDVEIRFYGQAAVAQGDESWEKKDGTAVKHVWTDIWVQRDGKWRIVAAEDLVPPVRGFRHP
jgi:Domain of unknown function (DUF4440)